jgi:site-specific DNA recombinase
MAECRAAFYARVSSEAQARDKTIASQVAALRERIAADGVTMLPDAAYIDEGHSGSSLMRPALERLRDAAFAGDIDRVYVLAPDRLARRHAHQALLMEEFRRAGVEVAFLNRPIGASPEDDLLLQIQGVIAEYERAQILERGRRGRRHAARMGSVSALAGAPYGYRYITRARGGGVCPPDLCLDRARPPQPARGLSQAPAGWMPNPFGHDTVVGLHPSWHGRESRLHRHSHVWPLSRGRAKAAAAANPQSPDSFLTPDHTRAGPKR